MPRNPEPPRHIPEEELHAYLDQALSRSQCVEIEHHLAGCHPCRADRDAIASLRDRTTALLVTAAPRRIRPRPYADLSVAVRQQAAHRGHRLRDAAWAATVVAALGLGWGLSEWSNPGVPESPVASGNPAPVQAPPITANLPPATLATTPARTPSPTPARIVGASDRPASRVTPSPRTPTQPEVMPVESVEPPRPVGTSLASLDGTSATRDPVLSGVWRTVAFTNSQSSQEEWVPRVEGVPVVQVKQRQAPQGGRPITLVTQLLANGEVISTVEGPATEVAALLSQQPGQSASAELQDMELSGPPQFSEGTAQSAPGNAPRTLAIFGSAPSDSLKAFMLRVK